MTINSDEVLQLQEPLTDGGIRAVNFFNGRLLTGKDLSREQEARREADSRLGLAVGDGVAFGLEISRDAALSNTAQPVVRIEPGLALNRVGQVLKLDREVAVALTRHDVGIPNDCLFAGCPAPLAAGTSVAKAGAYLLTVAPVEVAEGLAQSNGLEPQGVRCQRDALVAGIQFRVLLINASHYADLDPASPHFRNRLAHRCLGSEDREAALADPFVGESLSYGLVDHLRTEGLDPREVPLALLFWAADGLRFIDRWAVRRLVHAAADPVLAPAVEANSVRRLAETQAAVIQFQDQLAELLADSANPASLVAREHFRFLPPWGMVPLAAPNRRGVVEEVFFQGVVRQPGPPAVTGGSPFIDGRLLRPLHALAMTRAAADLDAGELLWVWRPWQNAAARRAGQAVAPVAVFASGLLPDPGVSRFGLARLDFSNYAVRGC